MLVQTIPAYRLPRETLAKEIRMIENMGVQIKTGQKLGRDFTLDELKEEGYQAVFLGIGAAKNLDMGIPGEDAEGVDQAVPFLKEYNLRGSVPVGKKVIVIGGGNAAIDAARTSIRLGAEDVTIVYRRSQEQMPAYEEEIEEALFEGVKLRCLTQPVSIEKSKDGRVSGLQCMAMELGEFDRSGRRRAQKTDDETFIIEADQVIMAIGQRLDKKALAGEISPGLNSKNFIRVNPVSNQTNVGWIFAGGDAVTGPSSVVDAIAEGEKAAVSIDLMLTGENNAFWREEKQIDTAYDPDEDPVPYHREKMPLLAVDKRSHNFDEVEQCWNESQAKRQGDRCLRCDYGRKTVAYRPVTKEDLHA
jgi:NADH-quinone oxidoreductase subunit F